MLLPQLSQNHSFLLGHTLQMQSPSWDASLVRRGVLAVGARREALLLSASTVGRRTLGLLNTRDKRESPNRMIGWILGHPKK